MWSPRCDPNIIETVESGTLTYLCQIIFKNNIYSNAKRDEKEVCNVGYNLETLIQWGYTALNACKSHIFGREK